MLEAPRPATRPNPLLDWAPRTVLNAHFPKIYLQRSRSFKTKLLIYKDQYHIKNKLWMIYGLIDYLRESSDLDHDLDCYLSS